MRSFYVVCLCTALLKDDMKTDKAKALELVKMAECAQSTIAAKFKKTSATLDKNIADIEAQLSKPLNDQSGEFNAEIRAHFKTLERQERTDTLNEAIEQGNTETTAAVLGAPAYLSGLTDTEHKHHTHKFHEATNPEWMERLTVVSKVKQAMERTMPIPKIEIEKAIGLTPKQVQHA